MSNEVDVNTVENRTAQTLVMEGQLPQESFRASSEGLTLRANIIWTFAGNVVYAACQWGMLVALAKLESAEIVGHFALGLAITAPVLMFANLQLRGIQATDAKREYSFADYLGLRLVTTGLAILAIIGITFASGYHGETAKVIIIIGLAKAFESLSDIFYGYMQQHERMDRIAISMMIKGVLSLIVFTLAVYLTGNLLWGVAGLAATWALILGAYDARSRVIVQSATDNISGRAEMKDAIRLLLPRWNLKTLGKLAWLALPLGIVMVLISLNTNIPRYFIERQFGARELGIFAAMSYLVVSGTTVISALGQSASPRLAKLYALGNQAGYRSLLLRLASIGVLLGVAGVLISLVAGPWILALLYQPEYSQYSEVLVWIMVSAGAGYVAALLGYGMTAARYFRHQAPLFVIVTLATIISCVYLVPTYGLTGAAWAVLIAATVQLVASLAVVTFALRRLTGKQERC
jgi:O-antigen/teichoic acid export membrane protein